MRPAAGLRLALCLAALPVLAQASLATPPTPPRKPTLAEVRKTMGIPSTDAVRGQQDAIGFASRPEQMARVWELSSLPPVPESLATAPGNGVVGAICPHDDYLFASRVYRQIIPRITAKTVVLVGVFHKYRRFGAQNALVFEDYRAWRSPDGDIRISELRRDVLSRLPAADWIQDAAMHDSEHSVEAIAYWLKHQRPDVEILPILVPSASFPRFQELAAHLGGALVATLKQRGWTLGKDVAIVISSDGIHYGTDFKYAPFGDGGVDAYVKAVAQDKALLQGPLAGPLSVAKAETVFSTWVNPQNPDEYRMPWCGRFSIPFGLLLLNETARGLGVKVPVGFPIAFGTSIGAPELAVKDLGMGATAPGNLYHFVSYPGVVFPAGQ